MKKHIMKKWTQALRSKQYKQGKGALKYVDHKNVVRHCCLGVLCELYIDKMKKNKKKSLTEQIYYDDPTCYSFDNQAAGLPDKVKEWSGINSSYGKFYGEKDLPAPLADLNDDGKTFKTIADIIKKHYENL